jgi:hypothetical protein
MRALLLLAVSAIGFLRARTRGLFDTFAGVFDKPLCECSCCIVERRNPSEVDGSVSAKCAVMPDNDPRRADFPCPNECTVINDPVLSNTNVVATQRFCFYKCVAALPTFPDVQVAANNSADRLNTETGGALTDSVCTAIAEESIEAAVAHDGNGRDAEEGMR